jgi:hypothetical protein
MIGNLQKEAGLRENVTVIGPGAQTGRRGGVTWPVSVLAERRDLTGRFSFDAGILVRPVSRTSQRPDAGYSVPARTSPVHLVKSV